MPLIHKTGDLLTSGLPAIAHGCNCQGVMGAGIARLIADKYPDMYTEYRRRCINGEFVLGDVQAELGEDGKWIFNLATQTLPGRNAEQKYVESCIDKAFIVADALGIHDIGIPLIGCGIGGLKWDDVENGLRLWVMPEWPNMNLYVYTLPAKE